MDLGEVCGGIETNPRGCCDTPLPFLSGPSSATSDGSGVTVLILGALCTVALGLKLDARRLLLAGSLSLSLSLSMMREDGTSATGASTAFWLWLGRAGNGGGTSPLLPPSREEAPPNRKVLPSISAGRERPDNEACRRLIQNGNSGSRSSSSSSVMRQG